MSDSFVKTTSEQQKSPASKENKFEMRGEVASGGMSTIHEVFDSILLRPTAMKLIRSELSTNRRELQRFLEEAQITGQLEHPNIVPVHELGINEEGRHYFTMKLVEGKTLSDILYSEEYFLRTEDQLYRVLQILLKICDAISFAHSKGVIHRDIKPENIMVGQFGQVYLMDWGISFLKNVIQATDEPSVNVQRGPSSFDDTADDGQIIGTYMYMSPEQSFGAIHEIDERTDVFMLGAVLYEMLTLQAPYSGKDVMTVVIQAQDGLIEAPQEVETQLELPARLCQIAMKALSYSKDDRHQSAAEFREDIENFLNGAWRFPLQFFPAGTKIVQEGATGDEAYIIIQGYCQAFKEDENRPVVLRQMGPGDVFGETSIFSNQSRTASVVALSDLTTRVVTKEYLNEQLGLASWLGRFVESLADRFCDLDARLVSTQKFTEDIQLLNRILYYMNFFGAMSSASEKILEWESLKNQLVQEFGVDEVHLLKMIQRSEILRLDESKTTLVLLKE